MPSSTPRCLVPARAQCVTKDRSDCPTRQFTRHFNNARMSVNIKKISIRWFNDSKQKTKGTGQIAPDGRQGLTARIEHKLPHVGEDGGGRYLTRRSSCHHVDGALEHRDSPPANLFQPFPQYQIDTGPALQRLARCCWSVWCECTHDFAPGYVECLLPVARVRQADKKSGRLKGQERRASKHT
jgi:hypothetical protein